MATTAGTPAFPPDTNLAVANFTNSPNNRSCQPRAYANVYSIPEKVYQYTPSVQQELPGGLAAAYVGSQDRNLFLRGVANNITQVVTKPNPASAALVIRQFSIRIRQRPQRVRRAAHVQPERAVRDSVINSAPRFTTLLRAPKPIVSPQLYPAAASVN